MKPFGVVDYGSSFLKYALVKDSKAQAMFELPLSEKGCFESVSAYFKSNGVSKVFVFVNGSELEVKNVKLESKKSSEGMFLEAEKLISQSTELNNFYIKYNRYQKGLSFYSFKSDLKAIFKGFFDEFELVFLPEELGLLNLADKQYLVLDIGHKSSSLIEVYLDRVGKKKIYPLGFANFLEIIQDLTTLNKERSFDLAMDYLKHPKTLNSRQLELVSEAARKFSRKIIEVIFQDRSKKNQELVLTGGGSFIPELVQKLYELNQYEIVHLSDLLKSNTVIFNNLKSYIKYILNQNEGNIIEEKLNKLLKVYNLNTN